MAADGPVSASKFGRKDTTILAHALTPLARNEGEVRTKGICEDGLEGAVGFLVIALEDFGLTT